MCTLSLSLDDDSVMSHSWIITAGWNCAAEDLKTVDNFVTSWYRVRLSLYAPITWYLQRLYFIKKFWQCYRLPSRNYSFFGIYFCSINRPPAISSVKLGWFKNHNQGFSLLGIFIVHVQTTNISLASAMTQLPTLTCISNQVFCLPIPKRS